MAEEKVKHEPFRVTHTRVKYYDASVEDKRKNSNGVEFYKLRIKTSPFEKLIGRSVWVPQGDFDLMTFRAKIDGLTGETKKYNNGEVSYSPELLLGYMESNPGISKDVVREIRDSRIEEIAVEDEEDEEDTNS